MTIKGLGAQALFAVGMFVLPEAKTSGHSSWLLSLGLVAVVALTPLVLFGFGGSKQTPPDPEGGDGWGKGPEPPPPPPSRPPGGIPLDDAIPARMRLRGPGRLSDQVPRRVRRPAREPARRPVRETTPA
jgi:hypothetical protein